MKYQLINPIRYNTAIEQILYNRGIEQKDFKHYINTTDEDLNSPLAFGLETLRSAAISLIENIKKNNKAMVIVDSDCDGFTSSALIINYLYKIFPAWTLNKVHYCLHSGKQHGLSDHMDELLKGIYSLVIIPDAGSNDYIYIEELNKIGVEIIILDHHEAPRYSKYAITINNQMCEYPNKELSGVGVTWQFCRYLDSLLNVDYSNDFIDLVALGLCGDMMSLKSVETKHLINKGFKPDNIKNPFIYQMWQKNKFKLGEHITSMGAAFYIVPFINAICRSGELSEKELIFKSMLTNSAFEKVLSNKRGHALGEMERVVDQAIRTCTNVKSRQTKAQDSGLEYLESMIKERNLLDHKVLLFLLEDNNGVDPNIRGLIANKFMAKYQRPCCILTKTIAADGSISYQGSARGYDKSGVTNFKDICEKAPGVLYVAGHQGAFGLGLDFSTPGAEEIQGESILQFIDYTDEILKDMSEEPIYYVDYIFNENDNFGNNIIDIANMSSLWGKDMDEAIICIKNFKVSEKNFKVMKSNTLKFTLSNKIDIIRFGGTEEEIETFQTPSTVCIDVICRCKINEWNGNINPQLELIDYEIVDFKPKTLTEMWGF